MPTPTRESCSSTRRTIPRARLSAMKSLPRSTSSPSSAESSSSATRSTIRFTRCRRQTASAARLPHAVVISDFSKALCLAGLRLGWIVDRDRRRLEEYRTAHAYFTVSGTALGEPLATLALRNREKIFERAQKVTTANLSLLDTFFSGALRRGSMDATSGRIDKRFPGSIPVKIVAPSARRQPSRAFCLPRAIVSPCPTIFDLASPLAGSSRAPSSVSPISSAARRARLNPPSKARSPTQCSAPPLHPESPFPLPTFQTTCPITRGGLNGSTQHWPEVQSAGVSTAKFVRER